MPVFAVAQMNSQDSIAQNLANTALLMQQAREQHVSLLVLPENFACFAAGQQLKTAERFDELQQQLQQLAATYHLWLVAGSIPCPYRPNGQTVPNSRVRSTSLLISPEGKTVARYDKIHLFDVQVGDNTGSYQESATFEPGDEIVVANTPFGRLGMMICYDLRFPELALALRKQGADFLTAPSAFTEMTGRLHWQLLLRARAADTQCYVLGAGQQGTHGTRQPLRQTWGHSAISNAAGEIVAERTEAGMGIVAATFDHTTIQKRRESMPLMRHRRLGLLKDF
ncbi:carbon-nitrogen hydrolase family protein [Alkanindiges illinoisensis]|uniref:carbon-nitrogen hydrolase family protein n=1 Tax=Alkanindiges illinoisensis TaxID=197183 RepID=UPI0004787244|nr:carbon-nitrogen hydrolase family protein [Alkanindiges illinoisensis]